MNNGVSFHSFSDVISGLLGPAAMMFWPRGSRCIDGGNYPRLLSRLN